MNKDIIAAIGGLWPLGFVAFLFLFILIFKNQIKNVLERFSKLRFKRGDTEWEVSQDDAITPILKEQETATNNNAEYVLNEIAATSEVDAPSEGKQESRSIDDLRQEMVKASVVERDAIKLKELYEELQKDETDIAVRNRYEAFYLMLTHEIGSVSALDQLQQLATKTIGTDTYYYVMRQIGFCYKQSNLFEKAIEPYEKAIDNCANEEIRVSYIIEYVKCVFNFGDKERAFSKLYQEISLEPSPKSLIALYEGLADLYELSGNEELKILALEKSLELNPNNTKSRFSLAFSYSNKSDKEMSLLHYKSLLRVKPDNFSALNNLGVQYLNLDMPSKAVEHYKKAYDGNNTLAAANIAYRLINAGFLDEALVYLDNASKQHDAHENVGKAKSRVKEKRDEEIELEKKAKQKALEKQRFMLAFGDAYFTCGVEVSQFEGRWVEDGDFEVDSKQNHKELQLFWVEGKKKYKAYGEVSGRASKINISEIKLGVDGSEIGSHNSRDGFVFLTPSGEHMMIMQQLSEDNIFRKLQKRIDPT